MTALEVLTRNLELALDEAETSEKNGYNSLSQYAYGQAAAYAQAISIIEADVPFTCRHLFPDTNQECDNEGVYLTPDGRRYCNFHAPADVDVEFSQHDDGVIA